LRINIFSENIHKTLEVDEKKALNAAKKILEFYLKEENIFNSSCFFGKDVNGISFDIFYCNNEKTHQINKEYRGKDYPADIITFAVFADSEEKFILDGEINLGEIIISLDKVAEKVKGKREKVKGEAKCEVQSAKCKVQSASCHCEEGQSPNAAIQKKGDGEIGNSELEIESLHVSRLTSHVSPFEDELYFLISHGIMHLLGFDHQTNEDYTFIIKAQNAALKSLEVQHEKL